ncbi:intermembrane space import and assembly protein [Geopyxis carbonaria]|nr:intermembrane space import and assembly protein [Geopyxis carbonaria]
MFRPVARTALRRQFISTPLPRPSPSRNLFTSAGKSRSTYKGTIARWMLAGGIVYYYATSNVFAEEGKFYSEQPASNLHADVDERPPSMLPEVTRSNRRAALKVSDAEDDRLQTASEAGVGKTGPSKEESKQESEEKSLQPVEGMAAESGAQELAEEAGQEGAFNPETGEINWDCPCLGGMANGPCGEDFKAAFSCFIYSEADPKGVDCIDKFKTMQSCFQAHPDIYGAELTDEDEAEFDKLEDGSEPSDVLDSKSPETRSPATSAADVNPKESEDAKKKE